jgi:hypothetical protein
MIVPLFVGRKKSIGALEEVMRSDTFVMLATQKNATDSMQVRILSRRYSSLRRPWARRWITRILLLSPSTKPSETLFSGRQ